MIAIQKFRFEDALEQIKNTFNWKYDDHCGKIH